MPNLSRGGADEKLLNAGRALLDETGISDLSLREVARRAKVNLGMFHYHFGSKKEFTRCLLQKIYEEFFSEFHLESQTGESHLARLRKALVIFGRFARDHRAIFITIMSEVLRGDKTFAHYFKTNIPRHAQVVADLIEQCQRVGEIKNIPVPVALSFVMGGMGMPSLVVSIKEKLGAKPCTQWPEDMRDLFLSDRAIEQRVDLILSALATGKEKRKKPK